MCCQNGIGLSYAEPEPSMWPGGMKVRGFVSTASSIFTISGKRASEKEVSHSSPWMKGVSNGPPCSLSLMCCLIVNHQFTLIKSAGTWYFFPNSCIATGIA